MREALSKRGSVLVAVLLILIVLLVGGMALNARQSERYKGVVAEAKALQALALAEAGLEDARVKLDKDPLFPPPGGIEQMVFTYTEAVVDQAGARLGSYTVTIDSRFDRPPYRLYLVTSVGAVGPAGGSQISRSISAEVSSESRAINAIHHGAVSGF